MAVSGSDNSVDESGTASNSLEKKEGSYTQLIREVFFSNFQDGMRDFQFGREEFAEAARRVGVETPKNIGDIIYSFRYRRRLPKEILATQPEGHFWLILGAGDAKYRFRLSTISHIEPRRGLLVRKIPDSTPEIISRYALSDEQALLAKVRYNRLLDIFLGISTYSLQNHLRTKIPNYGQIEIDEVYVGLDSRGAQYIIPVQAKGGSDKLGVIQTIQDHTFCTNQAKYADCIPRTVSVQFMDDDVIAMFEMTFDGNDVALIQEQHYKLVPSQEILSSDLAKYKLA